MDQSPTADVRFRRVYDEHFDSIRSYCVRRVDATEVNDVVSDVFLVVWRRLDDVPRGEATRLWLYGVARNVVSNRRRSQRRRWALWEKVSGVRAEEPENPETVVIRNADEQEALDALTRLSPKDQEIVRLRVWEELTSEQIGAVVSLSPSAVDMRLTRARRRLNQLLDVGEAAALGVRSRRVKGGESS